MDVPAGAPRDDNKNKKQGDGPSFIVRYCRN